MASSVLDGMLSDTTVVDIVRPSHSTFIPRLHTKDNNSQNAIENRSIPEGCAMLILNNSGFLPWDNPDNIVSEEVERMANRIMERIVVPVLFLIGGPANIINMAVFYKQGLKERINLCLFALSLADFLYLAQAMFLFGEQLPLPFITNIEYGEVEIFMANYNLVAFFGFGFVSEILSAIIATERCFCIVSPLKFQTLVRTRTMAVIITFVYVVVIGLYSIVVFKYHVGCVFDPTSGSVLNTAVMSDFYRIHKEFIDYVDSFIFGVGIPGITIIVVMITTIITSVKLRQIVTWRAEVSSSMISAREVALTKVLIANSLLFIACVTPIGVYRFVILFFKEINPGRRQHNFFFLLLWIVDVTSFINSTCNFFVYYAMGSRYRETFWALFSRKTKPRIS